MSGGSCGNVCRYIRCMGGVEREIPALREIACSNGSVQTAIKFVIFIFTDRLKNRYRRKMGRYRYLVIMTG